MIYQPLPENKLKCPFVQNHAGILLIQRSQNFPSSKTHLPLLFLNIRFGQCHGVGFLANIYFSVLKPWESKIKLLSWCCWEASSGIQIELLYDSLQGREKGTIALLQRKWSHSWVLFPDDLIASDSFYLQIYHQVKTSTLLYVGEQTWASGNA